MNFENNRITDIERLKAFLYKAKSNTFAANATKISLTDQTSVFSFRCFDDETFGEYIYNDKYSGNIVDGGQESISIDLAMIWCNQYYGGTRYNSIPYEKGVKDLKMWSKFITTFLKQALMQTPESFPLRGPEKFHCKRITVENLEVSGDWEYINKWSSVPLFESDDPFASFRGFETIKFNDAEIFWHSYHGGLIIDKFFPICIKK